MLWRKSWLETRTRFLIGLFLLLLLAAGNVFEYPSVSALIPAARSLDTGGGALGGLIRKAVELQRDYRGFIWWQWFRQNLTQMWTLFAVLLGTGGLLSQTSGGAASFTLSMPVSRARVIGVRAATAVAELLALALVPSLLLPLLSPAVGQSYAVADALVHGACVFAAGLIFFSLAFLLSSVFNDIWRPALMACVVAVVLAFGEAIVADGSRYGIFGAMTAEVYFRTGGLPWPGLFVSVVASAAMLYGAAVNIAEQDF
jgi:ABC-type transport system involved in multi-copper enzyme maturation permease subunit